ncbi:MAG: hypothetical protein NTY93_00360, partial [Candidatus Kaiserbacteria bacterium]|nr:hypothetical protein [Candidatus Kaiserbacteria bacterium]
MKSRPISAILAVFITITLIAPSTFLAVPQRAHAFWGVGDFTFDPYNFVKNTITSIASVTNSTATVAMQINDYVLQPLAFALSGRLMQAMTSSVLKFVNGETNGTGSPQFVQNLQGHKQSVGDTQALAFLVQFGRNSNSPFARAISSSLRTNYLQNTSQAGFWAANRCTLSQSSPNVNRFLAGDWSQGGAGAWFALTTQDQNNPYTLYQNSQSKLNSMVDNAVTARLTELNWGQGFLSWCGSNDTAPAVTDTAAVKGTGALGSSCPNGDSDCASGVCGAGAQCAAADTTSTGTSSGDPCTNKDGTPGTIKTPGSVIAASLNKTLGGTQDKLAAMGSTAKEINGIMKNIGTIANVANFASQLLGGSGSGGLIGISQPSSASGGVRLIDQLDTSGFLGVSASDISLGATTETAATLSSAIADFTTRVEQYRSAWNTISGKAGAASVSVTALESYCTDEGLKAQNVLDGNPVTGLTDYLNVPKSVFTSFLSESTGLAEAAHDILTSDIAPVFVQIREASTTIEAATAMIQKVQAESASPATDTSSYVSDVLTLKTMSPTAEDVSSAQRDARPFNEKTARLEGSAVISGNTLLDYLNIVTK